MLCAQPLNTKAYLFIKSLINLKFTQQQVSLHMDPSQTYHFGHLSKQEEKTNPFQYL
jgi:hypothetical protein